MSTTEGSASSWKFWKKRRYVLAFMGFLGFFNVYIIRVNLSIAIVDMTQDRFVKGENGTTKNVGPEFKWPNEMQGHVLSAFFYGYMVSQFPAGIYSSKYGGKTLFSLGVSVPAVLTLITPWLTYYSVYFLIVLRILEGVFQGATYPCIHALWARWAPPLERSRLATIAFSGCFVGTVVAYPACAYIADTLGWQFIFYICGAVALIWDIFWEIFIAGTPEKDKRITPEELEYIQESLKKSRKANLSLLAIPWGKILKSMPVWAIVVAHFGQNWGFYTCLTQLPKYLFDIFKYDLSDSGFLSALPYLLMAILTQFAGQFADWFLVKGILNTTQVRKLFNCGAFVAQTIFMLIPAFWSDRIGSVACLTLVIGLGAFAWAGFSVNHLDIAPPYASILMGFGQIFATMPGFLSPTLTGFVVKDDPTVQQWQIVFFVCAGIYVFGCIFYAIFASGELQPWAAQTDSDRDNNP